MSDTRLLDAFETASSILDAIFIGKADWFELSDFISDWLPGSFAAVFNVAGGAECPSFLSKSETLEDRFKKSYSDYYLRINTWDKLWLRPRNQILITEAESPASAFRNTEFYNDWLLPQKYFEAGVGMRLEYSASDILYIAVHFPAEKHAVYSPDMARLYAHLRRRLLFQLEIAAANADKLDGALARYSTEALPGRCFIVVDRAMRILKANFAGERELRLATFVQDRIGVLKFTAAAHQAMVLRLVDDLFSRRIAGRSLYLRTDRFTRVVRASTMTPVFGREGTRILLTFANEPAQTTPDFDQEFRLTAAESALCAELLSGHTVVETAARLGILQSTARQRLKSVLLKTGTSRQSELMRLMLA